MFWKCKCLKVGTHQTDDKELVLMKADCVVTCLRGKAAFEHTERTTADCQLACVFCACVLMRQLSISANISITFGHNSGDCASEKKSRNFF